jgi:hypothetical protein
MTQALNISRAGSALVGRRHPNRGVRRSRCGQARRGPRRAKCWADPDEQGRAPGCPSTATIPGPSGGLRLILLTRAIDHPRELLIQLPTAPATNWGYRLDVSRLDSASNEVPIFFDCPRLDLLFCRAPLGIRTRNLLIKRSWPVSSPSRFWCFHLTLLQHPASCPSHTPVSRPYR